MSNVGVKLFPFPSDIYIAMKGKGWHYFRKEIVLFFCFHINPLGPFQESGAVLTARGTAQFFWKGENIW